MHVATVLCVTVLLQGPAVPGSAVTWAQQPDDTSTDPVVTTQFTDSAEGTSTTPAEEQPGNSKKPSSLSPDGKNTSSTRTDANIGDTISTPNSTENDQSSTVLPAVSALERGSTQNQSVVSETSMTTVSVTSSSPTRSHERSASTVEDSLARMSPTPPPTQVPNNNSFGTQNDSLQTPPTNSSIKTPPQSYITAGSTSTQNPISSPTNTQANNPQSPHSQPVISNSSYSYVTTIDITQNTSTDGQSNATWEGETTHRPNLTESYSPGTLNQPEDQSTETHSNVSTVEVGVSDYPEQSGESLNTSSPGDTTKESGSSEGPSAGGEWEEGGVTEGTESEGEHLSPAQRAALGISLTVLTAALVFAALLLYKRRKQVGRWKLLDKSMRYRYWSYTDDCHQDDDIL